MKYFNAQSLWQCLLSFYNQVTLFVSNEFLTNLLETFRTVFYLNVIFLKFDKDKSFRIFCDWIIGFNRNIQILSHNALRKSKEFLLLNVTAAPFYWLLVYLLDVSNWSFSETVLLYTKTCIKAKGESINFRRSVRFDTICTS